MNDRRPAWREPMVWLVAALPAAAVIFGIWMLVVSNRAGNNDAVADKVQRTAQIQTTDLGPDERAQQLGLRAVLHVTKVGVQVFAAGGTFARNEPLKLTLLHPNQSAEDRIVDLKPDATGWSTKLDLDTHHDWNLQLTDAKGNWRLQGRLQRGQPTALLNSSLAPQ
jgi:uncharacterized protein